MNMKDFHAWVKAGDFDKPKMGDDSMHTRRLGEQSKSVTEDEIFYSVCHRNHQTSCP